MPYRAMALVAASIMTLSGSALAQKIEPTPDSKNLNTSRSNIYRIDGAFHQPGGQAAKTTTIKGSKSSNRMGAGGGGKGCRLVRLRRKDGAHGLGVGNDVHAALYAGAPGGSTGQACVSRCAPAGGCRRSDR